jgi:hypothetical protein
MKEALKKIKEYHNQKDIELIEKMEYKPKPGDLVKVSPGLKVQLRGYIGTVISLSKDSVCVEFEFFGIDDKNKCVDKQTLDIPTDKIKYFVTATI